MPRRFNKLVARVVGNTSWLLRSKHRVAGRHRYTYDREDDLDFPSPISSSLHTISIDRITCRIITCRIRIGIISPEIERSDERSRRPHGSPVVVIWTKQQSHTRSLQQCESDQDREIRLKLTSGEGIPPLRVARWKAIRHTNSDRQPSALVRPA